MSWLMNGPLVVLAFGALFAALRMREPTVHEGEAETGWRGVRQAGHWIWTTSFALALICFVLVLDSAMRIFVTLQASYYRMIGISESMFGVLGAVFAAMGFLGPRVARKLIATRSANTNFCVVAVLVFGGLVGASLVSSWVGVLFVMVMSAAWSLLNFFSSHYLNAVTDSSRRATVLSFRSLAGNLAYGAAGWAYALLFKALAGGERPPSGSAREELVFADSLIWIPIAFGVLAVPVHLWAMRIKQMRARP